MHDHFDVMTRDGRTVGQQVHDRGAAWQATVDRVTGPAAVPVQPLDKPLTAAQVAALAVTTAHQTVPSSNRTDATTPCVNVTVADRLVAAGLLEQVEWIGSVWRYRATYAGRCVLAGVA